MSTWSLIYQQSVFKRYRNDKYFSWVFTYKMAAKINWHRHGTKLRHRHPMYTTVRYRRIVAVYCKSVNCNSLTPLLRFVVDLLYNLFLRLARFSLTQHVARSVGANRAYRSLTRWRRRRSPLCSRCFANTILGAGRSRERLLWTAPRCKKYLRNKSPSLPVYSTYTHGFISSQIW